MLRLLSAGASSAILLALGDGPLRTKELTERIAGYAPRSVYRYSFKLADLGLVDREEEQGVPSKVVHSLSDPEGRDAQEIFDTLPKGVSTPELKIPMREGEHYRFIEQFRARAEFSGARLTTIDGVRADWPDGWGLVRASNTTPVLVLRFDADNSQALKRVQDVFRAQLMKMDSSLPLPF